MSSRGALPTYIKEGGSLGRTQVGGILLGPLVQFGPLPYLDKEERKEGEGKEVGVLLHTFLFLLSFPFLPTWLAL